MPSLFRFVFLQEALSCLKLSECISQDVRTVERIMCARPNTFELRTMRPRRHGDKQNLISRDTGSVITTRLVILLYQVANILMLVKN